MADLDPYRLPRTVLPRRYELTLEPDLDAATFTGTVAVTVDVVVPTDTVVLNALELTIDEAWVEHEGERIAAAVTLDETTERASLALDAEIPPGPARVCATFAGTLNDKLRGFYRSTFTDDEGATRTIATTQFEATDARRAFPCWDEPEMKAVFSVTLVVPENLLAVSNGAEVSSEPTGDGRCTVRFADTMAMSTYLVAFVVGPLVVTDPVDVDGVTLRVVHRAGQEALTAFALESGAFALRHFADYFGVAYPADKLDLVAVPDFAFGAMENLGCVTFRDVLLLIDPERATQAEMQRVADVVHHEIAHMWFGDLVTMRWWNGIWLNEAFATFMEMRCTDAFRPEWDRWTDFGIARSAAYDTDALAATRPIEFEVVSPADAEGMFDILTYEKGAAVVRMLEQYLGEDRFRDGIRLYISRHAHANTETTDLWDAIEEATGEPVRRIMDSWILQGGHPEVTLEQVVGEAGRTAVRLSQRRFRYASTADPGPVGDDDGSAAPAPDADADADGHDRARWAVPVLVRWSFGAGGDGETSVSGQRHQRVLLDGPAAQIDLGAPAAWVLGNSGGSGFFRTRYASTDLAALTGALDQLSPLERYGLVDDAWAGVLAGTVTSGDVLALVRALADETDLSVWQRVLGLLASLDRLVDDTTRPHLQTWVRALVAPAWLRLGPDPVGGESDRAAARRGALLAALGTTGADPDARARSERLVDQTMAGEAVGADLIDAAVRILAATGDAATFTRFRGQSEVEATPQGRLRYLGALADFPGVEEIDDLLASTLTDAVRSQDAPSVLGRAISNRHQAARAWAFVEQHWDELGERLPSNSIVRFLGGIRSITDGELADRVVVFLDDHPVPQGAKPLAQHVERMAAGVALRSRLAPSLADAFTSPSS